MTTIHLIGSHRATVVPLLLRNRAQRAVSLHHTIISGRFSTVAAHCSWKHSNNTCRFVLSSQYQHLPFIRRDEEKQATTTASTNTQQYASPSYRSFATLNSPNTTTTNTNTAKDGSAAATGGDPSYSDRARAGMTKARHEYAQGAKRTKAMAKAGAASSIAKLKQYGPVFAGTYVTIYVATLASLYAGVDSGLIDPATIISYTGSGSDAAETTKNTADIIIEYLNHYEWTKPAVPFFEKNPHFANLGVAWVATKFTEPVRLVIAMAVVPRLANYLGYVPQQVVEGEEEEPESSSEQEGKPVPQDEKNPAK